MITSRPERIPASEDVSIGDLFSQLAADTGNLIRQELRLAVAETRQNVGHGARSVAWLAAGAVLAAVGILVLLTALILILSIWMPAWLAAALVGGVLVAGGVPIMSRGYTSLKETEIVPDDSMASIKESTEWLKDQIKN